MPTERWANFEIDCEQYLNTNVNTPLVSFKCKGGSDAHDNDIYIFKNGNMVGSIEAKMNSCQSGQFVVLINENQFVFSPKNVYESNSYSDIIIDYLNKNFDKYSIVTTGGFDIPIDPYVMYSWVKNHYKNVKGSNYMITGFLHGKKLILPIEELEKYFSISASFRRKQSGTRHLSKVAQNSAYIELNNHVNTLGIKLVSFERIGTKVEAVLDNSITNTSNLYFNFDEYQGFLSLKSNNTYYIKMRSNTNNPNVVFSLALNNEFNDGDGLDKLINSL
jgi:hypothetical protein